MSPRRHFGCLECYSAFQEIKTFVEHWKNRHGTKKTKKTAQKVEILRSEPVTLPMEVDLEGMEIDNTPSPSTSTASGSHSSNFSNPRDEPETILSDLNTTPDPSLDLDPEDEEDLLDKYSDKCLIIGEKKCKVSLGSVLGERHLLVLKSKIHGRGLFTGNFIRKGEMIIEYAGQMVNEVQALDLQKKYDAKKIHNYIMKLGNKMYVDGTVSGNCSRFTNNSCNPNCGTNVISFLGVRRAFIYALRDIVCGEELTYDYKFTADELVRCNCGSKNCRGALNWNVARLKLKNIQLHAMFSEW